MEHYLYAGSPDHLRAQGETLNDEDIARLSPLCHGHINMLGHYSFTLAELVTKGHLRPLKRRQRQKTLLNVSFRSTERQTPVTDARTGSFMKCLFRSD